MAEDKQTSIVVVDDDDEIRSLLHDFLVQHHYQVHSISNGTDLFSLLESAPPVDLILLDIMLPNIDGIEICKRIREISSVPIIMLTALNSDADRIISLELGADDYVAKPFNPRELLARIKAVLRRSQDNKECNTDRKSTILQYPTYEFSGWVLDTATRRLVSPDQVEVALSTAIFDLLIIFLEHPQRVLSRDQLLDITKNRMATPFDRSIDVLVSRLRQKIDTDAKNPQLIKTVRSGGYLFASTVKLL